MIIKQWSICKDVSSKILKNTQQKYVWIIFILSSSSPSISFKAGPSVSITQSANLCSIVLSVSVKVLLRC